MKAKRFADHTQGILKALPSWFKMKVNPNQSSGADFLNLVGLELDDIHFMLDYAYEQINLNTIDVGLLDITYRAVLPIHHEAEKIEHVFSDRRNLQIVHTLDEFNATFYGRNAHQTLYQADVCLIDSAKNLIYTKHPYAAFDDAPYGKISYRIDGVTHTQTLDLHHVWTFFDELGMLLGCERLTGETNEAYKRRLENVFKYPRGSHKEGLINGISSDLDLRQYIEWADPTEPLILPHAMIVLNSIQRNDYPVDLEQVSVMGDGRLVLKPLGVAYQNDPQTVSYVCGLEMHRLHNQNDQKLQAELLKVDNTATDLLNYYVDRIHAEAPITWGHFKWGESSWDTSDKSVTGLAFVPGVWDSSISGFKNYNPK